MNQSIHQNNPSHNVIISQDFLRLTLQMHAIILPQGFESFFNLFKLKYDEEQSIIAQKQNDANENEKVSEELDQSQNIEKIDKNLPNIPPECVAMSFSNNLLNNVLNSPHLFTTHFQQLLEYLGIKCPPINPLGYVQSKIPEIVSQICDLKNDVADKSKTLQNKVTEITEELKQSEQTIVSECKKLDAGISGFKNILQNKHGEQSELLKNDMRNANAVQRSELEEAKERLDTKLQDEKKYRESMSKTHEMLEQNLQFMREFMQAVNSKLDARMGRPPRRESEMMIAGERPQQLGAPRQSQVEPRHFENMYRSDAVDSNHYLLHVETKIKEFMIKQDQQDELTKNLKVKVGELEAEKKDHNVQMSNIIKENEEFKQMQIDKTNELEQVQKTMKDVVEKEVQKIVEKKEQLEVERNSSNKLKKIEIQQRKEIERQEKREKKKLKSNQDEAARKELEQSLKDQAAEAIQKVQDEAKSQKESIDKQTKEIKNLLQQYFSSYVKWNPVHFIENGVAPPEAAKMLENIVKTMEINNWSMDIDFNELSSMSVNESDQLKMCNEIKQIPKEFKCGKVALICKEEKVVVDGIVDMLNDMKNVLSLKLDLSNGNFNSFDQTIKSVCDKVADMKEMKTLTLNFSGKHDLTSGSGLESLCKCVSEMEYLGKLTLDLRGNSISFKQLEMLENTKKDIKERTVLIDSLVQF